MDIKDTLEQRRSTHGDFAEQAETAYSLKDVAHSSINWHKFDYPQKEAIDMVLHKLSRLLCGHPHNLDSWRDIVGYAQLGVDYTTTVDNAIDVECKKFSYNTAAENNTVIIDLPMEELRKESLVDSSEPTYEEVSNKFKLD